MWLLPVVAGAIVPHAPLLLPELVGDEVAREASELGNAIRALDLHDASSIVVLSPHAERTGVYGSVQGDLSEFGIPTISGAFKTDTLLVDLFSRACEIPVLDAETDYGVLVPALIARWEVPIVAIGIGADDAGAAVRIGRALREADGSSPVAVVGSAHGSSALSARAPLTFRLRAREVEALFLEALQNDTASAATLARDLADVGGSCGAVVFETMGEVFHGRGARLASYRAPVGVGYLVAEVR